MVIRVGEALRRASELQEFSRTPQLDAQLLLAAAMERERTWLYTWPEAPLTATQELDYDRLLDSRKRGQPVAYLLGYQEFWSLKLKVSPATLIPRPETELLVEVVLKSLDADRVMQLADLGTGSGAIALAVASERANWQVIGTDRQAGALAVAETNRLTLGLHNVTLLEGDWCAALPPEKFDLIVSNPPYVAADDPHLEALLCEPSTALVAALDGLADIEKIAGQAKAYLKQTGYLLFEHGCQQADAVWQLLHDCGYINIQLFRDIAGLDRATLCQVP